MILIFDQCVLSALCILPATLFGIKVMKSAEKKAHASRTKIWERVTYDLGYEPLNNIVCSVWQHLRLGEHEIVRFRTHDGTGTREPVTSFSGGCDRVRNLCSPNEDIARLKKMLFPTLLATERWRMASGRLIESASWRSTASNPRRGWRFHPRCFGTIPNHESTDGRAMWASS